MGWQPTTEEEKAMCSWQYVKRSWSGREPFEDLKEGQGAGVQSGNEVRREVLLALHTVSASPENPWELNDQP